MHFGDSLHFHLPSFYGRTFTSLLANFPVVHLLMNLKRRYRLFPLRVTSEFDYFIIRTYGSAFNPHNVINTISFKVLPRISTHRSLQTTFPIIFHKIYFLHIIIVNRLRGLDISFLIFHTLVYESTERDKPVLQPRHTEESWVVPKSLLTLF